MHYRTSYRSAVKAALEAHADLDGFTVMSAWAQNIDRETLPVFGVATPGERKQLDTLDSSDRFTTIMVVLKILGGDEVEDRLDDLSVAVESVVIDTVQDDEVSCQLTDTSIELDGGEKKVGTLTLKFEAERSLAEPIENT